MPMMNDNVTDQVTRHIFVRPPTKRGNELREEQGEKKSFLFKLGNKIKNFDLSCK